MFDWLTKKTSLRRKAGELYGTVVAAARQPAFYGEGRVPDTPEGRFEMVALHLFLLAERVTKEGESGTKLAQTLIEAFVTDMDDCMREMGVGDLTVPKRVKKAAATFYKRTQSYRAGLQTKESNNGGAEEGQLAFVLNQALFSSAGDEAFVQRLAQYMKRMALALSTLSYGDIVQDDFSLLALADWQ